LENKTLYDLQFLAKASNNANIAVKADWVEDNLSSQITDTLLQTSGASEWTTFNIPVFLDIDTETNISNILLQFGFANNSADTYILLDDISIKKVLSAPKNLETYDKTNNGCKIKWDAAFSLNGLTGYDVFLDGEFVANVDSTSFVLENLSPGNSYIVHVQSVDSEGNVSAPEWMSIDILTVGSSQLLADKNLVLYPNPAQNKLYLKNVSKGVVAIYSIDGIKVLQKFYHAGESIDISGLSRGTYILKFSDHLRASVLFNKDSR